MAQWERICLPMQGMQETPVRSLGWEDPLEKEMATHSSILAWRVPWTKELEGRSPRSLKEAYTHNNTTHTINNQETSLL